MTDLQLPPRKTWFPGLIFGAVSLGIYYGIFRYLNLSGWTGLIVAAFAYGAWCLLAILTFPRLFRLTEKR